MQISNELLVEYSLKRHKYLSSKMNLSDCAEFPWRFEVLVSIRAVLKSWRSSLQRDISSSKTCCPNSMCKWSVLGSRGPPSRGGPEAGVRGSLFLKATFVAAERPVFKTRQQSDSLTHVVTVTVFSWETRWGIQCLLYAFLLMSHLFKKRKSLIPLHKIRLWQLFVGKTKQVNGNVCCSRGATRREVVRICELQQDSTWCQCPKELKHDSWGYKFQECENFFIRSLLPRSVLHKQTQILVVC